MIPKKQREKMSLFKENKLNIHDINLKYIQLNILTETTSSEILLGEAFITHTQIIIHDHTVYSQMFFDAKQLK